MVWCLQCEADAVAFVDEVQSGLRPHEPAEALPVLPDGSYILAPRELACASTNNGPDAAAGTRFEACLPRGEEAGRLTRVRLVLLGGGGSEGEPWRLQQIEVRPHEGVPPPKTSAVT